MHTKQSNTHRSTILLFVICTISMFFLVGWTTPDKDPFYLATPMPDGSPGDIIDVRKSVYTLDPLTKTPQPAVNSWQIIYQSENATSETIPVSGTVLVPTKPWPNGERPIIGFSVGTRGLGDHCAPSYTLTQGTDYEGSSIANFLDKGWAVVISDYEGLGTPGMHTYMVGLSMGRVALDMIRAAQHINEAGLSSEAPVALVGYSQGGAAASWAAQLASSYAPELNIIAASLGGVPADLEANGRFLDGEMLIAFAFMASVGLDAAYDDLNLERYLNDRGLELNAKSQNICLLETENVGTKLGTLYSTIDDHTTTNPIEDPTWQYRMGQQRLGEIAPNMPVLLYHAKDDHIVPFEPAAKLRQDWCNLGVNVKWIATPFEHVVVFNTSPLITIPWLEERFADLPALDNCPH
jgi:pimeloyl-ACP methyl ester carboxylesterase